MLLALMELLPKATRPPVVLLLIPRLQAAPLPVCR